MKIKIIAFIIAILICIPVFRWALSPKSQENTAENRMVAASSSAVEAASSASDNNSAYKNELQKFEGVWKDDNSEYIITITQGELQLTTPDKVCDAIPYTYNGNGNFSLPGGHTGVMNLRSECLIITSTDSFLNSFAGFKIDSISNSTASSNSEELSFDNSDDRPSAYMKYLTCLIDENENTRLEYKFDGTNEYFIVYDATGNVVNNTDTIPANGITVGTITWDNGMELYIYPSDDDPDKYVITEESNLGLGETYLYNPDIMVA